LIFDVISTELNSNKTKHAEVIKITPMLLTIAISAIEDSTHGRWARFMCILLSFLYSLCYPVSTEISGCWTTLRRPYSLVMPQGLGQRSSVKLFGI